MMDGTSAQSGTIEGSFADCVASQNARGFSAVGANQSAHPSATIVNSKITNNTTGLFATDGVMFLAQSTISTNAAGYFIQTGGVIKTFGNNYITDTNNPLSLNLTAIALQ
jgi:hypothetical protein